MMLRKKIGSIFLLLFGIYSHVVAGTGSLIVSWDPNKEADLKGYKIYYGTATRNYSSIVDVGNIISHTVNNLSEGVTYFFAVTAYDTAGNESDFSVEVSATVARSDVTPPTISSVEILSADRVNVAFSEPVEQASAENKANYKIDQGVEVLGATLDANLKVVHLTTTAHQRGQTYTITINNIQDRASPPNTIASNSSFSYYFELIDSTPPSISSVIILNETAVDVTFSEAVDKESAETEANYHIDKLVKVLYAILDDNLKLVHLITTSHQRGQTYTITINNIKDRAPTPNVIPANSSYSYYFDLIDIIPPTISSVTIRDENHLDVTFSEEVEQASAENKNNYRIDKGIEIQNVVLDANLKVVHLTTTTHQRGETYTISISNVRDRAPSPNTIAANSSYSYFLPTLDTTPPTIAAVEILEETRLDVTFSKQLERSSAEDKSNYSINKGIEVLKAILDNNLRIVHLTTSTHKRGELYTIVINNVRDRAPSPNTIAPNSSYTYYLEVVDTTPPTISSVAILNETRVDVTFSEKVDLETAQVSSNYRIDKGIKVKDAILDANHKVVHLSTSEHQRGETYTLTVNNVRDQAPSPNTIAANSSYSYYFELIDLTAPTITSVNILDETTVRVVFSEPVESASAETKTNYKIDKGIQVLLARQDTNASVVTLTTTSHQRGETYTITINNILDKASPPNTIAPNSCFSYTYTPNFLIKNLNLTFYELDSLKVGDEYYIDKHYTITYIPPDKEGLLWIKTANLDRDRTDDEFLSFEVIENIKVFIAYDSRAMNPPAWLRNFFIKTNQYIGVSESAQKLILWEQVFPAGKVTLGGNMAKGAFGTESMYLVLIQSGLEDERLPNSWNIPQMFLLYQNFPNPFNAETEIRFDLAERSHVSLNVYNILGQLVKVLVEGEAMAARHSLHWDGTDEQGRSVPSGLYFVRLEVAVLENGKSFQKLYQETRKMTIIR